MGILRNPRKWIFQVFSTIVFFVAGGILGVIFQEIVTGIINDSLSVMLLILVLIVSITVMVSILFTHVIGLSRPRPRVRYYEFRLKGESGLYRVASRVVRRARKEILASTSSPLSEWSGQSNDVGQSHKDYFQLLLDLSRKKGIRYIRVLQLQDSASIPKMIGSKLFLNHLHDLVDERDREGMDSRLFLSRVPPYRPLTVVLVDQRYLMWEVDEHVKISREERQDYIHMRGLLVIDDPTQQLLKPFHDFLMRLATDGRKVDKSELPLLV